MTETIDSANAAASTLFLGQNGEFWDFWLIVSLVFAAMAAIAIGVTTTGSIVSHKREAAASEETLERYKLDTSKTIAEANARTKESELALAKLKTPRLLNEEQQAEFVATLNSFDKDEHKRGGADFVAVVTQTFEANAFAAQLIAMYKSAGLFLTRGIDGKVIEMAGVITNGVGFVYIRGNPSGQKFAETLAAILQKFGIVAFAVAKEPPSSPPGVDPAIGAFSSVTILIGDKL